MEIHIKRAYEAAESSDGFRVLVDRLWPRGISKEKLKHDLWCKELAPSSELRKWFGHDPDRWQGFRKKYAKELHSDEARALMADILDKCPKGPITLVYGARDEKHNQAIVLADELRSYADQRRS